MATREARGPLVFFVRRWRREVPMAVLFWRDMVVTGSLLNLAAAFAGLMALGFKADLPVALAIFHAPLPYNIFIVAAIWRTAEIAGAAGARLGALVWLVAVTIL